MEIIIGTYEEFLIGYKLTKSNESYKLEQSFTNHAHSGSVRSLATSNKYLASGSVDEVIHLINMKYRVDKGTLASHNGTITALEFLRSSYLFSASDDGNICIWNTKTWKCEKTLRGHKEAVNSLSVHSSGKLLLSVSKDKTLRTWNLIKGRCAYIINLKEVAIQVLWSPSCAHFAVVFDQRVDIYDLSTGGVVHSIGESLLTKRIIKAVFINENTLIFCGDCESLVLYDIEKKLVINRFMAHKNRIKGMEWVQLQNLGTELVDQSEIDEKSKWLLTTSSDGFISIWEFDFLKLEKNPKLISSVDTTCRPTCMSVFTPNIDYTQQTDSIIVPELNISKEELEVCKTRIQEKKTKSRTEVVKEVEENEDEEIKAMTTQLKRKKTSHSTNKNLKNK